jgi:Transposase zinc-binding domain
LEPFPRGALGRKGVVVETAHVAHVIKPFGWWPSCRVRHQGFHHGALGSLIRGRGQNCPTCRPISHDQGHMTCESVVGRTRRSGGRGGKAEGAVMAGLTIQQILHPGDAAVERSHPRPGDGRKAVWALLVGRTAVWGGHIQACPEGHVERLWYHACRHRLCPPWAGLQVERGRVRQQARLLACDQSHGSGTRPDERRGLWRLHVRPLTNRLVATVHETRDHLRGDAPYLGACAGVIAALPPWSQTLVWHPPRPGVVTGGGLTAAGPWCPVRHGVLRPVRG